MLYGSELHYFSEDGFSSGALLMSDSTAAIHNKVGIVPFYLIRFIQGKCT